MVDIVSKRAFDDFDKRKFKEFSDELKLLGNRTAICNRLVEMLFSSNTSENFLAKDFLEYHDRHFYPNIGEVLEVADIVLGRLPNRKVN